MTNTINYKGKDYILKSEKVNKFTITLVLKKIQKLEPIIVKPKPKVKIEAKIKPKVKVEAKIKPKVKVEAKVKPKVKEPKPKAKPKTKKKYDYTLKEKYVDKYKRCYLKTMSRESFINEVLEKYPDVKPSSALRRFYDCKKLYGKQGKQYDDSEKKKPLHMKILMVEDMKRLKGKATREMLQKQHFATDEINWLEDEGLI